MLTYKRFVIAGLVLITGALLASVLTFVAVQIELTNQVDTDAVDEVVTEDNT